MMSHWLEQAIKELEKRDVVDAYYDALALLKQAEQRMIDAGLRHRNNLTTTKEEQ